MLPRPTSRLLLASPKTKKEKISAMKYKVNYWVEFVEHQLGQPTHVTVMSLWEFRKKYREVFRTEPNLTAYRMWTTVEVVLPNQTGPIKGSAVKIPGDSFCRWQGRIRAVSRALKNGGFAKDEVKASLKTLGVGA